MSTAPAPHHFDELMSLIGRINYSWTNTESLLIHFIAGLAKTEKDAAVIIFLTLNTTRARVDLVERLAKMESTPPDQRDKILKLTREIVRLSTLRNHYNHSLYAFDPETGNTRTIMMRIADRKKDLKIGQSSEIDAGKLAELKKAVESISQINQKFWNVIQEFGYPT